ncbi:MAG: phage portal protein, partial [Actinomycetota bacterium]|nr:phage portal protein [Actinomycetota bacterium]
MGFWDFLRRSDTTVGYMTPNVEYVGGPEWVERVHDLTGTDFRDASAAQLWRTQPHLRTVVSFLARNVAQLGLHTFERVDETDRRRDRTSPVAAALQSPDTNMTGYDLIYATVGDMALYDTAYWALKYGPAGGFGLRRLPPSWVSEIRDNPYEVTGYRISRNNQQVTIPASEVLSFSGYAPTSPDGVSPTIAALKETLAEQMEASKFRNQVWKRGGRVSAVVERPAGAPEWSAAAMERFREDWHAKYTGNGPRAGGTPILEDGMKLNRIDFSAAEQQFVEGAKLSFSTVAAAFHVNPTMVGILDNANYSNVREFRRMLYGDTLGPMLAQIEARVNTLLLPMLG